MISDFVFGNCNRTHRTRPTREGPTLMCHDHDSIMTHVHLRPQTFLSLGLSSWVCGKLRAISVYDPRSLPLTQWYTAVARNRYPFGVSSNARHVARSMHARQTLLFSTRREPGL